MTPHPLLWFTPLTGIKSNIFTTRNSVGSREVLLWRYQTSSIPNEQTDGENYTELGAAQLGVLYGSGSAAACLTLDMATLTSPARLNTTSAG